MKRFVALFIAVCLLAMLCGCEDDKRSRRSKSSRSDDTSELDNPKSRNRILAAAVDFDELEERDDSGEDLWYHGRSRTPFSGWIKGDHDNGELFSLESCKNGKVHGFFTTWYENGKKRSEGHFKYGKADGRWIMYTESGREQLRQTYKNGELISED